MYKLYDKVFDKLILTEQLRHRALQTSIISGAIDEQLKEIFFEQMLNDAVIRIIDIDNGDLSELKIDPNIQILFLRLNGIKVLSGCLKEFTGALISRKMSGS